MATHLMAFDEHLKRAFDSLVAELTEKAKAERDRAVVESRTEAAAEGHARGVAEGRSTGLEEGIAQGRAQGLVEGRTQGLEEGHARGLQDGRAKGLEEGRSEGWQDGLEQGRFEGRQEAEADRAAFPPPPTPTSVEGSPSEQTLDAVRALDRARTLSEILDTLASSAGREASRAAVVLVRGSEVRGWRFIGFDRSLDGRGVAFATSEGGVIAEALTTGAFTIAEARPPFAQPGTGGAAMPIVVAGEAVAALYADGSPEPVALELLVRHASRALEGVVALKAARQLSEPLANGPVSSDNGTESPGSAGGAGDNDHDADASARRFAKLLVSEIKLYHEPAVAAGRRDRDLGMRLGGEIARARVMYEQRVPQDVRDRTDYFHDELVRTLANGDPTLLQLS